MTAPWLIALLVAAVLALTVFDLLVSFDWKSYLARAEGAAQAVDEPDETTPTTDYDNHCVLCGRWLPDERLEYVVADRPEMWCVDLATCKAWRDEWMEMVP